MAKKKQAPDPSPDKLVRDRPRHYHTGDGRFEVQAEATGTWYLTDNEQTNDFGLPVLLGPFATLDAIKQAITDARDGQPSSTAAAPPEPETPPEPKRPKLRLITPDEAPEPVEPDEPPEPDEVVDEGRRSEPADEAPGPTEGHDADAGTADAPDVPGAAVMSDAPAADDRPAVRRGRRAAAAPPESRWFDALPPAERRRARELIEALGREGVDDAAAVVRADLEAGLPQIARTLLLAGVWREAIGPWTGTDWIGEARRKRSGRSVQRDAAAALRRLADAGADADDLAAVARLVAERTAGRVLEQVTIEGGAKRGKAIPGWRLTESGDAPEGRAIMLSEEDLLRAAPPVADEGD